MGETSSAGGVTVSLTHGMAAEPEHYIPYVYVKDAASGAIIGLKEFKATDAAPVSAEFEVPAGTTSVVPFAYCNLHGMWSAPALEL